MCGLRLLVQQGALYLFHAATAIIIMSNKGSIIWGAFTVKLFRNKAAKANSLELYHRPEYEARAKGNMRGILYFVMQGIRGFARSNL